MMGLHAKKNANKGPAPKSPAIKTLISKRKQKQQRVTRKIDPLKQHRREYHWHPSSAHHGTSLVASHSSDFHVSNSSHKQPPGVLEDMEGGGDMEGGMEGGLPSMPMQEVKYGDPDVEVLCDQGHTLDGVPGGQFFFTMRCRSTGEFTNANYKCEVPKFSVAGRATDAQNGRITLKEAKAVFSQEGNVVATAYTDASGYYHALVPNGPTKLEFTKTGYISQTKMLLISSSIRAGQGADGALSKVLPADGWRVVVTWDKKSSDIDSHTYFGDSETKHAYWPYSRRSVSAPGTGGIEVDLDRDDVSGYGPETTTFKGVGKCTSKGKCLIKFRIKNYSYRSRALGASNVKITLYNAASVHSKYEIPQEVGSSKWHNVFTLDASVGANPVVHAGDFSLPPYVTKSRIGYQNWWGSLDYSTWSKIRTGGILRGLYTTGGNEIYNIEAGHYYKVQNWKEMHCKNENWWGSFDRKGWSTCGASHYLAGFYRTGSSRDRNHGTYQLEEAWCCKIGGLEGYGTCQDQGILQNRGWSECQPINGQPSVMTGLYRSSRGDIRGIEKARCCTLPN